MNAKRITFPACLSALSLALLYTACLLPTGRLSLIAAAGLIPAAAVISAGLPAGFLCYSVTGMIGLLILPWKGSATLYLIFFGLYPLVKSLVERIGQIWLEWLLKLLFFNLILLVLLFAFKGVFFPLLTGLLAGRRWLIVLVGNALFPIYDILLSGCIACYVIRVDRHLQR